MKRKRLKNKKKPALTMEYLEKRLQQIFNEKDNSNEFMGPVGLVFKDDESEVYRVPGGALTGRGGWKLFLEAFKQESLKHV